MFRWVEAEFDRNGKIQLPRLSDGTVHPRLVIDFPSYIVGMNAAFSKIRMIQTMPNLKGLSETEQRAELAHHGFLDLPGDMGFYKERYAPVSVPWIPFFAFALLNCKNVVVETQTPEKKFQKHLQKSGLPPRMTFRTLKIIVPEEKKSKHTSNSDSARAPVRLHMCRGHFKNLQHERFKTKGWVWWPAHIRGSAETGIVVKDYALNVGT